MRAMTCSTMKDLAIVDPFKLATHPEIISLTGFQIRLRFKTDGDTSINKSIDKEINK